LLLDMLCFTKDVDETGIRWFIHEFITPAELSKFVGLIDQHVEKPFEPDGCNISDLLQKKRKRRARKEGSGVNECKEKEQLRHKIFKSARFVEDSDDDAEDEEFFQKEAELRRRMEERWATIVAARDGVPAAVKQEKYDSDGNQPDDMEVEVDAYRIADVENDFDECWLDGDGDTGMDSGIDERPDDHRDTGVDDVLEQDSGTGSDEDMVGVNSDRSDWSDESDT